MKPKRKQKPKRSLAKKSREPLYIVVQTDVESDVPVSPRFRIRQEPPVWATMVFTDKRKAELALAQTQELNPDEKLAVGPISVHDMLHHIKSIASIPLFQSQGYRMEFLGQTPEPVDAICVDYETTYPLVLSAFPKVYPDNPPYATFQEAFQALLQHIKRSRLR